MERIIYTGKQLKMLRRMLDITTPYFAELLGVTRATISNVENGKTTSMPISWLYSMLIIEEVNNLKDEELKATLHMLMENF